MDNRSKPKILVVDDESTYIDLLREHLNGDYQVVVAKNGEQALKRANSTVPPDLILLDVLMPDMSGYEVCKILKKNEKTRNIPVVFLTIKGEEKSEMLGFKVGAEDYIQKPFSPPIVHARVRIQLELSNQRHALEQQVIRRTQELEQARNEAVMARREAEQASQAKSRFLGNMSHELRTPLNHIIGFSELLCHSLHNNEKHLKYAKHVDDAGHILLSMIENVMHLTNLESDGSLSPLESVALAPLVGELLHKMAPLAKNKNITLPLEADKSCQLDLLAEQQGLTQALQQLFSNAILFNRTGGVVYIHCKVTAANKIRIEVKDEGKGIPESAQEKIFQPFERLDIAGSSILGFGFGLPIAKLLVKRMGGNIGVNSELGQGSIFWIELAKSGEHL